VDVRVIAATNRPLDKAVADQTFREDLYYRLKVVDLYVPPLRERREEIPRLAQMFIDRFNAQFQRDITLSDTSLRALTDYGWPGNVRELENMMKRIVVLQTEHQLVDELGPKIVERAPETRSLHVASRPDAAEASPGTLKDIARRAALDAQREAIRDVLERVHWNRAEAARLLGISYKTLLYKIDQCGLARKRSRPGDVADSA
jgi:two-component system response regulator AtoC